MIIKCPECGRQVSEKAPQCPSCGVEIAGKIIRCANCGEVYFLADRLCPMCHQINGYRPMPHQQDQQPQQEPQQTVEQKQPEQTKEQPKKQKHSYTALIIAFIFAALVCGGMFAGYIYTQQDKGEKEAYENALQSTEITTLDAYLEKYKDVNPDHYKRIKERLATLQKEETDWKNIVVANSSAGYREFMNKYGSNSIHYQEAKVKIDSIDWSIACTGDEEALKRYINDHQDGQHVSDAEIMLQNLNSQTDEETEEASVDDTTVEQAEKDKVTGVCRKFFQAMNTKGGEASLKATLASSLSFNGKSGANADDAVAYMREQYKQKEKAKQKNFNWKISSDSYSISKKVQASDDNTSKVYTYQVTFKATKEIEDSNGKKSTETHSVSATINSAGKISNIQIR